MDEKEERRLLDLSERLEEIVASSPTRQATAYAALTLTRLLSPQWTHVVKVVTGKTVEYQRVGKPAGTTVGDRAGLKTRLTKHMAELEEWSGEERDAFFQKVEPPGSYGLCWKLYTDRGTTFNCTQTPDHKGECGGLIHLMTQRNQPYGSERRCCEECGTMIWGGASPAFTTDPAKWKDPPPGWRRCRDEP